MENKKFFRLGYIGKPAPGIRITDDLPHPYLRSILQHSNAEKNSGYFRIIFPPGVGQYLMEHSEGILKGLKTTNIVEKNKIVAVAGLEKVEVSDEWKSVVAFFAFSHALHQSISRQYLEITSHIRSICLFQERSIQARFEKISYDVESSLKLLPTLLLDDSLRAAYLNRIVQSNSECYELFVFSRENYVARCKEVVVTISKGFFNGHYGISDRDAAALRDVRALMKDNVFGAFERFCIGKICESFISKNFSEAYLNQAKGAMLIMRDQIISAFLETKPMCLRIYDQLQAWFYEDVSNGESPSPAHQSFICEYEKLERELQNFLNSFILLFDEMIDKVSTGEWEIIVSDDGLYIEKS